ncbi:hypothetical protein LIER_28059 [Lithospermum erythrorhizon]|uniref:Polyprotein n=1 Tax=Lithospermum erythrorhizon TaxID=34254 RepID=A0AAV3RHX2_LITER
MLSHAKLPRSFWGEAMVAAVQVINLSPTHVLEGKFLNKYELVDDLVDWNSDDELCDYSGMTIQENNDLHTPYDHDQQDNGIDVEINTNTQQPIEVEDEEDNTQDGSTSGRNTQAIRASSRSRIPSTRYLQMSISCSLMKERHCSIMKQWIAKTKTKTSGYRQ